MRTRFLGLWTTLGVLLAGPLGASAGPSISGTVTLLGRDGKPKTDRIGTVVFLDAVEHQPAANAPGHAAMHQANKQFSPEVLPIVVGTTVEFPNDDTVFHNVFSLSRIAPFDLGIYAEGQSRNVTFDQPGLVKVYCNIHPQMAAYILVLPNAYFAITDPAGRFTLTEVPVGSAVVRAWHPHSRQTPEQPVQVTPEGIRRMDLTMLENVQFEIRAELLPTSHKNKFGQDYPAQY